MTGILDQVELAWRFNHLEHRNARGEWSDAGAPAAVFGDPATARHTVVFVPGVGSGSPDGRQHEISRAREFKADLDAAGQGSTAVAVWGYDAPGSVGAALSKTAAEATAGRLASYANSLKDANPHGHLTVIGHSYGSAVSGIAAARHGMKADDLVVIGSPGVTARHASELRLPAGHVWAGAEHRDPVARLATALSPDFHGNPDHPGFGAVRFAADSPGQAFPGWDHPDAHTSYFNPDSQALPNMTAIATGQYGAVTRASDEAKLLAGTATAELGWRFNPAEARDAHGEWVKGGVPYKAPDHTRLINPRGKIKDPADHPFFKAHPVSAANVTAAYDAATPSERAQGMRWYADAHDIAESIGHGDTPKAAALLATYSPQTSWPTNMFNASRVMKEGRALGPGDGMITGAMQRTAQKVLDGQGIDQALPSSKTNAFAHLIADGGDSPDDELGQVVIDRHAMSVAAGHRMSKADLEDAPVGQDRFYQHIADAYRDAAVAINARGGEQVAPHQLQAITWLHQQAANEAEDAAGHGTGGTGASKGRAVSGQKQWARWNAYAGQQHIPVVSGTTALSGSVLDQLLEMAGNINLTSCVYTGMTTITGQATELAAWEHELRDVHGRWTKSITGQVSSASPYYNDVPETRGISRTKSTYGDAGTGREREDAERLAAYGQGAETERVASPITAAEARGNSRPVAAREFQRLARIGRDRLAEIQSDGGGTHGLDAHWTLIKKRAYAEVQESWGGTTVDPRTGEPLPQGADKYAMSIKPAGLHTVSVPEHASPEEFSAAMDAAKARFGSELAKGGSYLGVFHDDDNSRIDIDPVTVLDTQGEVESVGAYTHAIGGAYHFATGNGYWPPHVASG